MITHGHYITDIDWREMQQRISSLNDSGLGKVFNDLIVPAMRGVHTAADRMVERASELAKDQHYTAAGRAAQLKDLFVSSGGPALRAARVAVQAAQAEKDSIRSRITLSSIDKTDVAGAFRRWEARQHLKAMDPARRTAMIHAGEMPALFAHAIAEMPAEMTGVTPEAKARVETELMMAAHPTEFEKLEVIDQISQVLEETVAMGSAVMRKRGGLSPDDMSSALGDGTFRERIEAKLAADFPNSEGVRPEREQGQE